MNQRRNERESAECFENELNQRAQPEDEQKNHIAHSPYGGQYRMVSRSPCELTAYHDESQWWKANPDFQGFPIQCHSIILQKALDELKSLGNNVSIRYFDDVQETDNDTS